MSGIPVRGIGRNAAVIMLAITSVAPTASKGQVTIGERVVIRDDSLVSSIETGAKTTAGVTAPYDGWFKIFFDNAYKLSTGIFLTAEMSFLKNGMVEATDLIIQNNRLGTASTGVQDLCGQGSASSQIYPTGSDPIWTAGRVLKDDEIQVSYDGKVSGFSYITTYGPGPPWQIEAGDFNCIAGSGVVVWNEVVQMTGVVVRDTLTIEIDEPKSVWPRILRKNEDGLRRAAPESFDLDSYLGSDSIEVTVTVTDEVTPISGSEVTVAAEWVSNSGGHSHSDPPAGWMKFRDLQNPSSKVPDEITVTTDSNGEAHIRFFAPPWGGRARIRASTSYNSVELSDVDSLTVKVPDLLPLAAQPGASALELIGGTCDHHGPRNDTQYPESCLTPDNNHYGVVLTLATLIEIDLDWAVDAQKQTGLPQGAKAQTPLQVNDISLPFGGKFQESGIWTKPTGHTFHQLGRDVDLRTQRSDELRVGIYVFNDTSSGTTRRRNMRFEEMIDQEFPGVRADVHRDGTIYEHYHLYFYGD